MNSTVSGNDAEIGGGIGLFDNGHASVVNTTVSNNRASVGGGIAC